MSTGDRPPSSTTMSVGWATRNSESLRGSRSMSSTETKEGRRRRAQALRLPFPSSLSLSLFPLLTSTLIGSLFHYCILEADLSAYRSRSPETLTLPTSSHATSLRERSPPTEPCTPVGSSSSQGRSPSGLELSSVGGEKVWVLGSWRIAG